MKSNIVSQLVVMLVIAVVAIFMITRGVSFGSNEESFEIQVADRQVVSKYQQATQYLIFTDKGTFNAPSLYGALKVDVKYYVTVKGKEVTLAGSTVFREIIRVSERR